MNVEKRSALTPNRWVVSEEHLLTILDLKDLLIPCGKDWKPVQNRLKMKASNDTHFTTVYIGLMD